LSVFERLTYLLSNRNCGRKLHFKRPPNSEELEDRLHVWVLQQRTKGLMVSDADLAEKAKAIALDIQLENFRASRGWIWKFKKRKKLGYRSITHTARKTDFTDLTEFVCGS
jgi:Tc5 transposase DNA-binding domain